MNPLSVTSFHGFYIKGYVIKSKRVINYRGQIEREFPSHEDVQKMCFNVTKVK